MAEFIKNIALDDHSVMSLRRVENESPRANSLDIDHTNGSYLIANPKSVNGTQSGNVVLYPASSQLEINEPIVFSSFDGYGFLSSPYDARFDYVRRKLWIADTGNHSVLKVDINSQATDVVLNNIGVFPHALASNLNEGGVFVKSYSVYDSIGAIYCFDSTANLVETFYYPGTTKLDIPIDQSSSSSSSFDDDIPVVVPAMPSSNSMTYDHVRKQLWWVDGSKVYMMNEDYRQVESLSLLPEYTGTVSVDVELSTGFALVVASVSRRTYLIQISRDNSTILARARIED
jgi:hypothetical protein